MYNILQPVFESFIDLKIDALCVLWFSVTGAFGSPCKKQNFCKQFSGAT